MNIKPHAIEINKISLYLGIMKVYTYSRSYQHWQLSVPRDCGHYRHKSIQLRFLEIMFTIFGLSSYRGNEYITGIIVPIFLICSNDSFNPKVNLLAYPSIISHYITSLTINLLYLSFAKSTNNSKITLFMRSIWNFKLL